MRLAVFTNQFPSRVSTFFARDMGALLAAGAEIAVFPMHPEQKGLWRYVPAELGRNALPRHKVHHVSLPRSLRSLRPWPLGEFTALLRAALAVGTSARRFGLESIAKTAYVLPKAWYWAQCNGMDYDHVLAYWGNYSATCAQVFHRLLRRQTPFSMFLHGPADLYRNQVYLREKLLYADNIIVVCEFNRNFIRNLWPDIYPTISRKILVHHIGLDLDEFPYDPDGRVPHRIVAVGRFVRGKGFDNLLRAIRHLREDEPDLRLELIGDGEERRSLAELAERLNIRDRIFFPGWLTPDEVKSAIRRAAILVHPSVGFGDAVPTVIKEAMALGTPVVASSVGGIPELLDEGRCGILVPSGNVVELTEAIRLLLHDTGRRHGLAADARRYAEGMFDMWKNGARLAGILSSTGRSSGPERSSGMRENG